jgi:hypothetical protein
MTSRFALVAVAVAAVATLACGGSAPQESTPPAATPPAAAPPATDPAAQAAQAAQGMQQALQQMGQQTATAVDFEKLVALLPEVDGWTRGKPKGEQVSMGITMSNARVEYQKGEASIDLTITDSSFNQLVLSPFTMFLAQGYSERSSDGYSKSAPMGGNPGFEKWENEPKRGEVTVVVGNRFIVNAKGQNLENIDAARAVVQAVNLGTLAGLK